MYHHFKLDVTGGTHSVGDRKYFKCNYDVHGVESGNVNQLYLLARGSIGDECRIVTFTHGRIKVTMELLPE